MSDNANGCYLRIDKINRNWFSMQKYRSCKSTKYSCKSYLFCCQWTFVHSSRLLRVSGWVFTYINPDIYMYIYMVVWICQLKLFGWLQFATFVYITMRNIHWNKLVDFQQVKYFMSMLNSTWKLNSHEITHLVNSPCRICFVREVSI